MTHAWCIVLDLIRPSESKMFPIPICRLIWYNSGVKPILPFLLVVCASFAGMALPPASLSLPPVAFADTETTTNASFVAWQDGVREFAFSLDCIGGPENNVQISFGTDSNGNGILDLGEFGLTVGWDSGSWFVQHGPDESARIVSAAVPGSTGRRLCWVMGLRSTATPKKLSIEADGVPVFPELTSSIPTWAHSTAWNMMRLTGRGSDFHEESFWQQVRPEPFSLILR